MRKAIFGRRLLPVLVLAVSATICANAQMADHFGSQVVVVPPSATQEYTSIAIDSAGNLYIGDLQNKKVYKETLSNGTYTQSVAVDLTSEPYLGGVLGVAVDSHGNLYVSDGAGEQLLKETPAGGGTYTQTVIVQNSKGSFVNPGALAVDSKGNVFCTAQTYNFAEQQYLNVMYEFTPASGGTYTQTQVFNSLINPDGLAIDGSDNLYIDDVGAPAVYKETFSGGTYTQSTVVDDSVVNWLDQPGLIAVDNLGDVFVANGGPFGYNALTVVEAVPAAGGMYNKRNFGGGFGYGGENAWEPYGIAADNNGNVFITAYVQNDGDFEVQQLSSPPTDFGQVDVGSTSSAMTMSFVFSAYQGGNVSSSASGEGASGEFVDLGTGTCATNGTSFVYKPGDSCTVDVKFTPKYAGLRRGVVTLVNSVNAEFAQQYLTGTGIAPQVSMYPGTVSTIGTGLTSPQGVAVDGQGIVYILDTGNLLNVVTETPSGGTYTQGMINYSGSSNNGVTSAAGLAADGSDCLYTNVDIQGAYYTVQFRPNTVTYTCTGGYIAEIEAGISLNNAQAVAADGAGNAYVADTGNNRVLEIYYSSGSTFDQPLEWYTVVAGTGLNAPAGVAADSKGNVYIADTGNNRVLKETPAGTGTFTQTVVVDSGLSGPTGLAVDAIDNLYISDTGNKRVLKETVSGSTYTQTVALAGLGSPQGLALDGAGNLYIADATNKDVVKLQLATGPTLTFASTAAGTTSSDSPQTVTISNVGTAPLTFPIPSAGNNPSISANFSLGSTGGTACPLTGPSSSTAGTLAANASCTLPISFTPASNASGTVTGSLVLTDNDLNSTATTQTVSLNGTTTEAAAPVASLSPTTLAFGDVTVGSASAALSTTLSNTGNATLNITGVTLSDTTDYAETSTCGSALDAGKTCSISVTFKPGSATSFPATLSVADDAAGSPQTVTLSGTGTAAPVITETGNLWFNPAPVAIAAASAQTLTATFTLTGFSSVITPTAKMHYGLAYKVGKVTCTGSVGNQTCTVPVTFIPNLPGGRKDALFLMNGTTRLATELAYGIGQSAFALVQPGVVTNPIINNNSYLYDSTVDENGTLYILETGNNAILSVTAAGVVTTLPITGLNSPRGVGIDGAGVLYIADQKPENSITTYDTVQGIQGGIPYPSGAFYVQNVTAGNEGNIYATDSANIYTIKPDGTTSSVAISPANTQANRLTVDSNEDLFIGGYAINEITAGGTQTQINTAGAGDGLSADAALTLYACRYSSFGSASVAELPASGYSAAEAELDSAANPLGCSDGPDGTLYVGNYTNLDKVDRSQGAISFGEQSAGTAATPQTIQIYNGGNESLALSNISVTGEGFTIQASTTDNCSTTATVAVGALCNLTVAFLPTHAGVFSGTVTFTSNSLNNTTTTQTIALSGFVYGVYVSATPNPLAFGSVADGTTSAPLTVTFTNNGDLYSANIGGFSSTDPAFVVTPGSCFSVAVGSTCTATVTFAPTDAKAYSATISFSASSSGGGPNQNGSFTATGTGTSSAPVVTETGNLFFNPAPVAIAAASAQTLTATFTLTNFSSVITPTAKMNYGLAYKVGAVTCTGSAGNQTCTVPVTFIPNLPGGHRDALFLMNGTTRLATELAYGVGQSGLALVQPGIITLSADQGAYLNTSVVAEDGTVYIGEQTGSQILSRSPAGVITALPITGLDTPRNVAVDGAGIVYTGSFGLNQSGPVTTYDTVLGVQGTLPYPTPDPNDINSVTVNNTGSLYLLGSQDFYVFAPGSAQATVAIDPGIGFPQNLAVDSANNLFIGGNTVNEVTPGGTQTQVNSSFIVNGIGTDAADTLYLSGAGRGVEEFPASDYTTTVGTVDAADSALGVSVALDGTVYVSNYSILDTVDRSQGSIDFGTQTAGTAATPQTIQIYNGGNENLTISNIAISGSSTFTTTNPTNPCTKSQVLAPGTLCNLTVGFLSQVPGSFSGSLNFTTNSLNATSTTSVALAAVINGAYMVPSPTSLNFGSVTDGSTSSTKTITLTNQGYGVAAQVYSPASTDPAFTVSLGTCNNVNVAVGDSCQLNVTFSPAAVQSYSATGSADVTNAGPGGAPPVSFTLAGTGTAAAAPAASLSPTTLSFPSTTVGSTSTALSTTLSNTGNATLNISGITLTGVNPTDFAETTTCGSTLAAGKTCTISATFTPATVASYTASISVADDATGSPQTVALSGTGTGGVTASPTSLNMGSQTEYTENYTPQYITLTNNTSSTVTFSNFASSDPTEFNSQDYSCTGGGIVEAGTSCQISVRFSPLHVGPITATITMPYTGAGGGTLVVQLTGTGTAGTPAIDLYPLPVNFGELPVLTAATPISLQVEATGTAPLTGIGFTITGTNAADFTETDNCSGVTIDPYPGTGSCNVTVSFTPSAGGPRSATLNVTSNSGAATFSTPLSGAGVAQPAQLQFSPTQLNLVAGAGGACADATAGGPATAATLCNITGSAQDYLGNTYLVDNTYNAVYKVDTTGTISVFAGTPSKTGGYTGDNGPATSATLSGPTAVAADAFGNIFISDTGNSAIREVDTTGNITSFIDANCNAGGRGTPKHRGASSKPDSAHPHEVRLCETFQPEGLVVDSFGNLIFADTLNNVVLEVGILSGDFSVVAGDAESLQGTAGYNGDNIPADTAELNAPQDVAVDPSGNIYIADTLNYRIRKVTASTGIITTVAGDGTQGDTGDGAAATSATIDAYGVTTDLAGDIFIATGTGGIVRKVDASGNINLFAGGGTGAIGGPASTGAVTNAYFARTDNSGNLLIPAGTQLLAAGPDGLLQFGSDAIGTTTAALNVTLENTADTPLSLGTTVATITGTNAADFALTSSTCGYNLQPGKTCVLSVTFDPTATGARTASLSVPTNATGSPQIVLLQGNGSAAAAPAASLSPTSISFPSTAVGSTATAISTTLSNTGNAVLNISGITLTGANPTDFAETTTCGTTLAAGSTCTISATFTPSAVASYTASISVADNATGSPQTATLSGTGTAAPAPIASLSPTTLSFPATTAGSTATALSTTLSNTGNATLTITGITLTGANPSDFAIATSGTTCASTLAAGSTCTIAATFTPSAAGSFTATLSVADNAAGSPQTATLSGTGNAAPATDFNLAVTPPAQTVAPGGVASFTVNTTGIGGAFDSAIQLTATGLPSGYTATFTPSSVTPGANGASSVLTIQTTSLSALAQPGPLHRAPRLPITLAVLLIAPLLGLRKRFRKLTGMRGLMSCLLLFISLVAPVLTLTGCGGGYYSLQTKTYTVTVTGTSGSIQHSTTVTLTVQQ